MEQPKTIIQYLFEVLSCWFYSGRVLLASGAIIIMIRFIEIMNRRRYVGFLTARCRTT